MRWSSVAWTNPAASASRTGARTPAIILPQGLSRLRAAATSLSWRLGFALLPLSLASELVGEGAGQQPL